jgi:hypothetical protein
MAMESSSCFLHHFIESFAESSTYPQLETSIVNQTKNYLVTKSVSLIVVDYFAVMVVRRVPVATTHYLVVAAGKAVDCWLPSSLRSRARCSEPQPLLLAANAREGKRRREDNCY